MTKQERSKRMLRNMLLAVAVLLIANIFAVQTGNVLIFLSAPFVWLALVMAMRLMDNVRS